MLDIRLMFLCYSPLPQFNDETVLLDSLGHNSHKCIPICALYYEQNPNRQPDNNEPQIPMNKKQILECFFPVLDNTRNYIQISECQHN
jgi:hypothetical protein